MSILMNNSNINRKYNCKIIEFNADATKFGSMGNYWPKKALQGVRVKAVKKPDYTFGSTGKTEDLINATMKIETFSGDFEDGLGSLEISLVVNGSVELASASQVSTK